MPDLFVTIVLPGLILGTGYFLIRQFLSGELREQGEIEERLRALGDERIRSLRERQR